MNIRTFGKNLAALDLELPAPLADVGAIREALGHILFVEKPLADFDGELLAGQVTAANAVERVRAIAAELVHHEKAQEVANNADGALNLLERRALIVSGDNLVEQMRPHFDTAVGRVAAFVDAFGADPAAEDVLAADGAEHWRLRTAALTTLDHVDRVCRELRNVNYYYEPPDVADYVTGLRDADHLNHAVTAWNRGHFVELIAAGYTLRLNTGDEAAAVVVGVRTAEQQARVAVQAEKEAELQRRREQRERLDAEGLAQRKAMAKQHGGFR